MRKRVLASGAFELIHSGHVKFLEEARKLGGENSELIVVVARDETIRRRKGREPILGEESRRYIVSMLKPVDKAILGHVPFSFSKVIEEVKPDLVVFGHDQEDLMKEFIDFVKRENLKIEIAKVGKFSSGDPCSTSEIIQKISKMLKSAVEKT